MEFLPLILAGLQALDLQLVLVDPIKTGVVNEIFQGFRTMAVWKTISPLL